MNLPIHAGEIQARQLGVAAYAFDDAAHPVVDQVGELVLTEPLPSMPGGLLGRYRVAPATENRILTNGRAYGGMGTSFA